MECISYPGFYEQVGVGKWLTPFRLDQLKESCVGKDLKEIRSKILLCADFELHRAS